jgi:hypothetical protein
VGVAVRPPPDLWPTDSAELGPVPDDAAEAAQPATPSATTSDTSPLRLSNPDVAAGVLSRDHHS